MMKDYLFIPQYTAVLDYLLLNQWEGHRFKQDKYRRGVPNTGLPMTEEAYINE